MPARRRGRPSPTSSPRIKRPHDTEARLHDTQRIEQRRGNRPGCARGARCRAGCRSARQHVRGLGEQVELRLESAARHPAGDVSARTQADGRQQRRDPSPSPAPPMCTQASASRPVSRSPNTSSAIGEKPLARAHSTRLRADAATRARLMGGCCRERELVIAAFCHGRRTPLQAWIVHAGRHPAPGQQRDKLSPRAVAGASTPPPRRRTLYGARNGASCGIRRPHPAPWPDECITPAGCDTAFACIEVASFGTQARWRRRACCSSSPRVPRREARLAR